MGWKDSRAGSTIEEIGFGLQTPLIQPPPNPAPKTSMPKLATHSGTYGRFSGNRITHCFHVK